MELKRILIVEDDADIAAIERDYLELGGYAVTIAPDGTTGLDAALHQPFDLILLDVMLPGIDGFAICKQVRAEKDIPILMVTARGEDVDKIRGLGFGADDYIEKPFSPSVLVARVKARTLSGCSSGGSACCHLLFVDILSCRIRSGCAARGRAMSRASRRSRTEATFISRRYASPSIILCTLLSPPRAGQSNNKKGRNGSANSPLSFGRSPLRQMLPHIPGNGCMVK